MSSTLTDRTEVLDSLDATSPDTSPDTSLEEFAESFEGPAETDPAPKAPAKGRRARLLALIVAGLLALGGGTAAAVAAVHKSIELDLDGDATSLGTFAGNVGDLLQEQGITLSEHDVVVPGPATPLSDGTVVAVRYAAQVPVTIDGEATSVWAVGDTAAAVLAELAAGGQDPVMVADRSAGVPALPLPLVADGPVEFLVDGESLTVQISGVADLASALLEAEIEVGAADRISVAAAADGPVVTITRISTEESTRTESIDFKTVERGSSDLYKGETRVVTEGTDGVRTFTYVDRLVDGEVTSSRLSAVEVTTKAVDRVVEFGTADRPAPEPSTPAPTSSRSASGSSGSSGGGGSAPSGTVWAQLAQCESGGNPRAVSANGLYYGLYQFSIGTWKSVGGTGLPSEASAAEQTQRAQTLQARSGWGQWPHCSSVLGLR